jgi:hypothetical protein
MLVEMSDDEDDGSDEEGDTNIETGPSELDTQIKELVEWMTARCVCVCERERKSLVTAEIRTRDLLYAGNTVKAASPCL